MTDNMSQHCPNCEDQAAQIEYWKAEVRSVRKELESEQKTADNAMDNYDTGVRRIEAQAAEIERLRETLGVLAPMVNWLPHPDCVTAETAIRAALAGKAEQ